MTTARRWLRDVTISALGGALGAMTFLWVYGPALVWPTNVAWTLRDDLQIYQLAWTHFRHEPWQWPLGAIHGVGYPVGTSIGNTDALPLVALLLKPWHAILPVDFQYLGAWMLWCFVMQGVCGVWLMRLATADRALQLLGAALFVQTPALINRTAHPALCAHWIVLAALWLLADGARQSRRWHHPAWLGLSAVGASVQPYLAGMFLPLALTAILNRVWIDRTRRDAWLHGAGAAISIAVVMGLVFWQCGYFQIGSASNLGMGGVGHFSMNLLSPIAGMGLSTLLPDVPLATAGQYEGLVYFGAGWLLVCLVTLALLVTRASTLPSIGFGWWGVAACTLVAMSPVVTIGPAVLFDLRAWTPDALAVFRSSGRFGWVPMYATLGLAAMVVASARHRSTALTTLSLAVLVQTVDLSGAYSTVHARMRSDEWLTYNNPLKSAAWDAIVPNYRHLVTVPPDMCRAVWADPVGLHLPFSLLAGRHHATVNSGFAGRYDVMAIENYCASLEADIRAGRIDDDSVYVLSPAQRDVLLAATRAPLTCGRLDGFAICATAASSAPWREAALRAGFSADMPISAR